ncbi:alpha-L-fucosidase-domain-containing protein [Fusarium tricinctum]|uniref:alpha-L-fucosidase n=1 Tax=Fusarium tricinctum TaxID=61284 RepID=A0A8K0WB39_9HYPO|nr:alpha-L-fucosidase-domain-containing protein [Fusarium tricinctum]
MINFPTGVTAVAAIACAFSPIGISAKATGPYKATWESTDKHNPSPEWFRDAKFGVYWHWGAFTTAQYASEWYPRNMYEPGSDQREHHTEVYGPPEEWGYENFIKGAKDRKGNFVQFKPVLKSKGGEFDPEALINAVRASGARFAGPVGEHHDGYSMWDSKANEWNSVKMGPKIDLVKLWADLVRKNGMKLVVAMHQAYNYNGFYQWAPQTNDTSLQKLLGQLPRKESDKLWLDKHREMLDHVQPDIIWNDFSLNSPGECGSFEGPCGVAEQTRLDFLAYYFNRGVEWGKEVVTTYKHHDFGFRLTSAVNDYERGGPANITRPYWLTDDAISASSWSYTVGIKYYTSKAMVHSLLDRISKGGNMLLNISPTAAGVLPVEQVKVLHDIGDFLGRFGEAVYGTRAWDVYGEGPNQVTGGSFTAPLLGNSSDIRFTRNKEGNTLYVSVLGWPENNNVSIDVLGSDAAVELKTLKSIELLGDKPGQYKKVAKWEQTKGSLDISLPAQPIESFAYVLKLKFDKMIPVPQPKRGAAVFSAKSATGHGVTLGLGSFNKVFLTEAGLKPQDVRFIRVSAGTKVTVYSKGDLSGDGKQLKAGEHSVMKGSIGSIAILKA